MTDGKQDSGKKNIVYLRDEYKENSFIDIPPILSIIPENKEEKITDPQLTKAAFELQNWQIHGEDAKNFTAELYRLISKADMFNRAQLLKAYPSEVICFIMWQSSETPEAFFSMFDL